MRIGLPGAETLQGGSLKALVVVSVQRMLMPLSHYIGFTWDGFRLCVCEKLSVPCCNDLFTLC